MDLKFGQLFLDLDLHYNHLKKPLIARNVVLKSIDYELICSNPDLYDQLYKQFYVFYALFAQNTRDEFSQKTILKIYTDLKDLKFKYTLEFYKNYFYKHKEVNLNAMIEILSVLSEINSKVYLSDFTKIKRVGYKTASLIYNEFYGEQLPIVDINVFKAYKNLCGSYEIPSYKTPDSLFFKLVELNNFCDDNLGFELSRLLHTYGKDLGRKIRRSKSCKKSSCFYGCTQAI